MKKAGVFLIIFVLTSMFLVSLSKAQEDVQLPDEVQKIQELGQNVTNDEGQIETDYLKEEWRKIIGNSGVGRLMEKTEESITPINPLFKVITGINFSWSFLFFLNLVIWACMVIYSYRILEFVAIFSRLVKLIIAVVFVILISLTGVTGAISRFIINSVTKIDNLGMQIVAFVCLITFFIFLSMYSKFLKDLAIKMKEKRDIKTAKETAKEANLQAQEAKAGQEEFYDDLTGVFEP
jgi:hypothetical protein